MEIFDINKSIIFNLEICWYREKSLRCDIVQILGFDTCFGLELLSFPPKNWDQIQSKKKLVAEKSLGSSIVQILGFVAQWCFSAVWAMVTNDAAASRLRPDTH